jgi:hypothetical protein
MAEKSSHATVPLKFAETALIELRWATVAYMFFFYLFILHKQNYL